MIRINNIHLPLDYTSETVLNKAAKSINVDKKFFKSCTIFKRSVDARKKDNIFFLATVEAELIINEEKICKKFKNAEITEKYEYNVNDFKGTVSPVVVGAGPAGLLRRSFLRRAVLILSLWREAEMLTHEPKMCITFGKAVFLTQQAMCSLARAAQVPFQTASSQRAQRIPVSARCLLNL